MNQRELNKRVERGVAASFLSVFNAANGSRYVLAEEGEAPDFACRDEVSGTSLAIEVATVYYDGRAARSLWDILRGKALQGSGAAVNPQRKLAAGIGCLLRKKWRKDYGQQCMLVLHLDAPLTTAAEFEEEVLPLIPIPAGYSPFLGVYARLKPDVSEGLEQAWWQLFPEKRRFSAAPNEIAS